MRLPSLGVSAHRDVEVLRTGGEGPDYVTMQVGQ